MAIGAISLSGNRFSFASRYRWERCGEPITRCYHGNDACTRGEAAPEGDPKPKQKDTFRAGLNYSPTENSKGSSKFGRSLFSTLRCTLLKHPCYKQQFVSGGLDLNQIKSPMN